MTGFRGEIVFIIHKKQGLFESTGVNIILCMCALRKSCSPWSGELFHKSLLTSAYGTTAPFFFINASTGTNTQALTKARVHYTHTWGQRWVETGSSRSLWVFIMWTKQIFKPVLHLLVDRHKSRLSAGHKTSCDRSSVFTKWLLAGETCRGLTPPQGWSNCALYT